MKNKICIGSRESRLAVIQSEMVMDFIRENCPETELELLTMKTTGDLILDRTLDKVGGKGLFVKELDRALMDRRSDLSVHSLKDMPMDCLLYTSGAPPGCFKSSAGERGEDCKLSGCGASGIKKDIGQ